jgi:hypothetical protein
MESEEENRSHIITGNESQVRRAQAQPNRNEFSNLFKNRKISSILSTKNGKIKI